MIIGLTGTNGAGKGAVADLLVARGFKYTSLSDAIRSWLDDQGIAESRQALTQAGRTLRRQGGAGVLAERLLTSLSGGGDYLVDSIRNPAEVAALRGRADFRLIEVRADETVRFERIVARRRGGDVATFEAFSAQEAAELTSTDSAGQQLAATAALADVVIDNSGSLDDLTAAVARVLETLRAEGTGRA